MSLFSNAVSAALDAMGWSQTHLAEITGIPRPRINRYARGASSVESESLRKLVAAFPAPHDGEILAAYLQDAIPPEFEPLVSLSAGTRVEERPDDLPRGLDPELRRALISLALLARRHTEISDLLIRFERVVRMKE